MVTGITGPGMDTRVVMRGGMRTGLPMKRVVDTGQARTSMVVSGETLVLPGGLVLVVVVELLIVASDMSRTTVNMMAGMVMLGL